MYNAKFEYFTPEIEEIWLFHRGLMCGSENVVADNNESFESWTDISW